MLTRIPCTACLAASAAAQTALTGDPSIYAAKPMRHLQPGHNPSPLVMLSSRAVRKRDAHLVPSGCTSLHTLSHHYPPRCLAAAGIDNIMMMTSMQMNAP